jgi:hypothetical protein
VVLRLVVLLVWQLWTVVWRTFLSVFVCDVDILDRVVFREHSYDRIFTGALARNGWLPQGFAFRSNRLSPGSFEKKHVGALARGAMARVGLYPTSMNTVVSPSLYTSVRNARVREFRPPLYRGPRAFLLKSEPTDTAQVETCKCKRSADTRLVKNIFFFYFSSFCPKNESVFCWSHYREQLHQFQ